MPKTDPEYLTESLAAEERAIAYLGEDMRTLSRINVHMWIAFAMALVAIAAAFVAVSQ